jgi:Cu(I)/Ag(I) efflux system membrane fusion protein
VSWRGSRSAAAAGGGARRALYYVDPMHPSYRSPGPGKAPDCGMDLTPVYAEEARTEPAGAIRLSPEQEFAARFATELVELGAGHRTVRTIGRVTPDESRLYRVSAGVDGWVRRVYGAATGTRVRRGEALAVVYSRDLSGPQQAYLYALESYERLKERPSPPAGPLALAGQQLASTRNDLEFAGMDEGQITELGRRRREFLEVSLTSPVDGQVLERNAAPGQRFMKGETLYRIAATERVWVTAELHRGDAAFAGRIAKARVRAEGADAVEATVAAGPVQFDEQGRAGRLRLEMGNPGGRLTAGMLVVIELDVDVGDALTVSADAVVDSGAKQRVFVASGSGRYEAREVELGWEEGGRVEVRSGLQAGERVVTAGAFLLDSESRIRTPGGKR